MPADVHWHPLGLDGEPGAGGGDGAGQDALLPMLPHGPGGGEAQLTPSAVGGCLL